MQLQPHPVGQTVSVPNQSDICCVWPPCPHTRQKLEEPKSVRPVILTFICHLWQPSDRWHIWIPSLYNWHKTSRLHAILSLLYRLQDPDTDDTCHMSKVSKWHSCDVIPRADRTELYGRFGKILLSWLLNKFQNLCAFIQQLPPK